MQKFLKGFVIFCSYWNVNVYDCICILLDLEVLLLYAAFAVELNACIESAAVNRSCICSLCIFLICMCVFVWGCPCTYIHDAAVACPVCVCALHTVPAWEFLLTELRSVCQTPVVFLVPLTGSRYLRLTRNREKKKRLEMCQSKHLNASPFTLLFLVWIKQRFLQLSTTTAQVSLWTLDMIVES